MKRQTKKEREELKKKYVSWTIDIHGNVIPDPVSAEVYEMLKEWEEVGE